MAETAWLAAFSGSERSDMAQQSDDEPLIPTPIPALVAVLLNKERAKGMPLSEEEVLAIRDESPCVVLPLSQKLALEESRGYADIDPDHAWEQWQDVRVELQHAPDNREMAGNAADEDILERRVSYQ